MKRFATVLPALLVAASATAQVAVTTLPGPPSCYPGTGGDDHTMFIRAKSSQADCDVIGGGSPCLARREFAGDGPNGRPISLGATIVQKPSVVGAGDFVAFPERGFNVCLMATASEDTEGCFGRDFLTIDPHSISISPAGDRLAITQLDAFNQFLPTNDIYVLNPNTFQLLEHWEVATPEPGGTLLQLETVEFSVDGDFLIVDARNPVSGLWGIYAVSRTTGATSTVVAPVAGLHIRNPALAQTSDDHIVFDAQDPLTFANTVYAANLLTGELTQIATTQILSYPSYTGDDGAVVFTEADATVTSLASLDVQPLGVDRLTPVGNRSRWLTDGGAADIYRRGAWSGVLMDPTLCVPPAQLHFNPGLNQISIPRVVPEGAQSCFALLEFLGGAAAVGHIGRFDPTTQTFQECRFAEGQAEGQDFLTRTGEGYLVLMLGPSNVNVANALSCPDVSLATGLNLVGIPGPADGLSCFGLLDRIGTGSVVSIERLDPDASRYEACVFDGSTSPAGADFPIVSGKSYVVYMQEDVASINLNDTADSSKCGT